MIIELDYLPIEAERSMTCPPDGVLAKDNVLPAPIASGRAGGRLVMPRCTRARQRTNGRHLGTLSADGRAVGRRSLDDAALSGSKMPGLRGNDRRLGAGQFDSIAEVSECADHSGRPVSLGLLAEGWASFLVPDALMQDLPD